MLDSAYLLKYLEYTQLEIISTEWAETVQGNLITLLSFDHTVTKTGIKDVELLIQCWGSEACGLYKECIWC